ncbi:hypothetical protein [Photobacterium leiognathi]|uniref:hypothetical protein n=1 Tax=Photobacterium leiognathi TaxID=553611 RepID=UPI002980A8E4|nr:hypothetical protein [Photobacterium leiognathi]
MMNSKTNDRFFLNLLVELVKRSQQLNANDALQVIGTFPHYLANDTEVVSWERGIKAGFSQKRGLSLDEISEHVHYALLSVDTCISVLKNSFTDFGDVSDVITILESLSNGKKLQLVVAAVETPVQSITGGFEYDINTICAFSPASVVSNHFE